MKTYSGVRDNVIQEVCAPNVVRFISFRTDASAKDVMNFHGKSFPLRFKTKHHIANDNLYARAVAFFCFFVLEFEISFCTCVSLISHRRRPV